MGVREQFCGKFKRFKTRHRHLLTTFVHEKQRRHIIRLKNRQRYDDPMVSDAGHFGICTPYLHTKSHHAGSLSKLQGTRHGSDKNDGKWTLVAVAFFFPYLPLALNDEV